MKSFKEYLADAKVEKEVKINEGKGGHGYFENMFDNDNMKKLNDIIKTVIIFIKNSEDYAEEEGITVKKQKKLIIEDFISYIESRIK
jgi:hypothetical protein